MLRDSERVIVLKKTLYRESDLIVRGINTQGSKISFLAAGGARSRRRFGGGVLEPTHFIEITFEKPSRSRQPHGLLPRVREAIVIREFEGLRRDYDILQAGLQLLALVDRVCLEGDVHGEGLFNLLGHALQALASQNIESLPRFRLQYSLKFLYQQGVLELAPWMQPFLQFSIAEQNQLTTQLQSGFITGPDGPSSSMAHQGPIDNKVQEAQKLESWILDRLAEVDARVEALLTL